jgi:hypothetical protein
MRCCLGRAGFADPVKFKRLFTTPISSRLSQFFYAFKSTSTNIGLK